MGICFSSEYDEYTVIQGGMGGQVFKVQTDGFEDTIVQRDLFCDTTFIESNGMGGRIYGISRDNGSGDGCAWHDGDRWRYSADIIEEIGRCDTLSNELKASGTLGPVEKAVSFHLRFASHIVYI